MSKLDNRRPGDYTTLSPKTNMYWGVAWSACSWQLIDAAGGTSEAVTISRRVVSIYLATSIRDRTWTTEIGFSRWCSPTALIWSALQWLGKFSDNSGTGSISIDGHEVLLWVLSTKHGMLASLRPDRFSVNKCHWQTLLCDIYFLE